MSLTPAPLRRFALLFAIHEKSKAVEEQLKEIIEYDPFAISFSALVDSNNTTFLSFDWMSTIVCATTRSALHTRLTSSSSLDKKSDLSIWSTIPGKKKKGGLPLLMGSFQEGRSYPIEPKNRGLANRRAINGTGGEGLERNSSAVNGSDRTGTDTVKAAFFDVDGTITRTNVVMAYSNVRKAELGGILKLLWVPWFVLCCIVYLIIDHFHRPTFNRIFYRSYKGRPTDSKAAMAKLVFEKYYKPRIMAGAAEQILELKRLGYLIVLVTGSLDFLIEPLAEELGADHVYAVKLAEKNGRFTGGIQGTTSGNKEKAERIGEYARRHNVSLRDSLAFGDSIADIPMLEVVGKPHAVNPDGRLQDIALKRGWAILNWKVKTQNAGVALSAS